MITASRRRTRREFPVAPAGPGHGEPEVDLRDLLDRVYDGSGYDLEIDDGEEPVPPVRPEDREWAGELTPRT